MYHQHNYRGGRGSGRGNEVSFAFSALLYFSMMLTLAVLIFRILHELINFPEMNNIYYCSNIIAFILFLELLVKIKLINTLS